MTDTATRLAHMVFFTLKDASDEAQRQLVDDCYTYLKDHPGVEFFAAGRRDPGLTRPVNDLDFHVGLHIVFESREAHDRYQQAPAHLTFIERNRENWAQVRVFDSLVR